LIALTTLLYDGILVLGIGSVFFKPVYQLFFNGVPPSLS
jgi:hypothetical protein